MPRLIVALATIYCIAVALYLGARTMNAPIDPEATTRRIVADPDRTIDQRGFPLYDRNGHPLPLPRQNDDARRQLPIPFPAGQARTDYDRDLAAARAEANSLRAKLAANEERRQGLAEEVDRLRGVIVQLRNWHRAERRAEDAQGLIGDHPPGEPGVRIVSHAEVEAGLDDAIGRDTTTARHHHSPPLVKRGQGREPDTGGLSIPEAVMICIAIVVVIAGVLISVRGWM